MDDRQREVHDKVRELKKLNDQWVVENSFMENDCEYDDTVLVENPFQSMIILKNILDDLLTLTE